MCSGKTTLGRALSHRLGCPFIDLDQYIEQHEGMAVKDIFATKGEEHFRKLETRALKQLLDDEKFAVIALGGGTPCHNDNMELMEGQGTTVWLQPCPERLTARLVAGAAARPLLAGKTPQEIEEFSKQAMASRQPFYSRASHAFDSSFLENGKEITSTVDKFIATIPLQ